LLAALDAYHHQHGYFPRNFAALQPEVAVPPDYVYEVIGMNRVYDSFACAARSNEFYGVIKDPASYQQRLTAFLSECVLGYASFVLKSSRIHTQRSINSNVVAFAKFSSQGGRWELDWCSSHPTPGSSGDCRHFAMNEAAMYDPESSDHRATHRVVHVGRPTPASAGREP
jgi:hypothetical protein